MSRVRLLALVLGLALMPAPALAQDEDPGLEQQIEAGQEIVAGNKVLARGHVDVGPRFVDGRWRLMIHDDVAKSEPSGESVWRHTEQTIFRVLDAARLPVPDDPTYAFLGAEPGTEVFVVPQTQDPDVVWVGWNTQDPEVMERIDRGVTMTLTGVQGPGRLVVYLQSGDFAEPEVLWDSAGRPKQVWVDVNTHTHANWVFSEPGVYLVQIRIEAELIDGTSVADTRRLRFAVGSATATGSAFAAAWRGGERAAATQTPAAAEDASGSGAAVVVLIVLAAGGLLAGFTALLMRGNRAKQRART